MENVAKVVVIYCLIRKSVIFCGVSGHFLLGPGNFEPPFVGTLNVVLQPQGTFIFFCLCSLDKSYQGCFQFLFVDLRLIPLLATGVHVFGYVKEFRDHLLAEIINLLSIVDLMPPLKERCLAQGLANLIAMLLPINF